MNIPLEKIQWVEFPEHPISLSKNLKVELFDIHSLGLKQSKEPPYHFNHPLYCKLILEKVLQFNAVVLPRFLAYQCDLMARPYSWLINLELLLEHNVDLLIELNLGLPLNNSLNIVNEKRETYEKVPPFYRAIDFGNGHPYRFDSVKLQLEELDNYWEKKIFLLRMKTDYLQYRYSYDGMNFGEQIDLELEALEKRQQSWEEPTYFSNMIWNGQINQLVDIFFQCLQIKDSEGHPLLEASNERLVKFIENTFCKKNGDRFSTATIRTILKSTRHDKRPKGPKKIEVRHLLKSPQKGKKKSP